MCKFSKFCQGKGENCLCSKKYSKGAFKLCQNSNSPINSRSDINSKFPENSQHLLSQFQRQSELIKTITNQSVEILQKLEVLSSKLTIPLKRPLVPDNFSGQILSLLSSNSTNYNFSLELKGEVPCPAYKEKAFSITAEIVDNSGASAILESPQIFKILLFTKENPPQLLSLSNSGDRILRGNVEVEAKHTVHFNKVVVKQVTSHYKKGSLYLAITCKTCQKVKPLVIENFVVKARKTCEGLLKKQKLSN